MIPTFNDPAQETLLKTLWNKKKMLFTIIFSFSNHPNVLFGKELRHFCRITIIARKCF